MKNKKLLLILGIPITLVFICICIAVVIFLVTDEGSFLDSDNGDGKTFDRQPLKAACLGDGVAEAAAYTSSSGIHQAVFVKKVDDEYIFTNFSLDSAWRATFLEDAELVVCVENQVETVLETCEYTLDSGGDTSITRIRINGTFRLVEAQSGKELLSSKATADPRQCLDSEQFDDGLENSELRGDLGEAIAPLIQSYVEIP